MSSMLERMVMRTRSGLPGVEPVHRSRYAPSVEPLREFAGADEPAIERSLPSAPSRTNRPSAADEKADQSPGSAGVTPAFPPAAVRTPSAVEPLVAETAPPSISPRTPRKRGADEFHDRGAATQLHGPAVRVPRARPRSTASLELTAPRPDSMPPSAIAEPDVLRHPVHPVTLPDRDLALAAPLPDQMPAASGAVEPTETHRPQGPATHGPDAEPSPRPHVTISIGHIEVRAAPASEPLRPPAFRPKVTLDDFLGREPGGRR